MAESEGLLTDNQQATQETQENWYSDDFGELVQNKGWEAPDDVLKSYRELEKNVGGRVKLPTPESAADEVNAFYQKLGKPVSPDAYEIERPEMPEGLQYDEEMEKALLQTAFEEHLTQQQMQSLSKKFNDYQAERYQAMVAEQEKNDQENLDKLRGEWKTEFDKNVKVAQRACQQLGGDELIGLLDSTRMGNNATMIKAFYEIGTKVLDDSIIKGGGTEEKDDYVPSYPDSPQMYANDESEDGKKARAYFEARGHKY